MNATNKLSAGPWLRRCAIGVVLLYFISAFGHVFFGSMNADEGFYAVAARAVMQGEMPYRDFGYTQTPLLPFINGLVMRFTGYGLFEQRAVNGVWGALALALAAFWLARRTRAWVGLLLVVLFSLTPGWMYFIHLGKTYAFTALVVVAAAWVFLEQPAGWRRTALIGVLGVVGVGCRLPAAPFFAVLWIASLKGGQGTFSLRLLGGGVALAAMAVVALGPFYLAAPEGSVFWTLQFHRLSVPNRLWHVTWQSFAALAPALWVAVLCALVAVCRRKTTISPREGWVTLAAIAALAANFLPRGAFEEYAVPFLLPLAMSAGVVLHRAFSSESHFFMRMQMMLIGVGALITAPLIRLTYVPVMPLNVVSLWLPPGVPSFRVDLPALLWEASRRVTLWVPGGQPLIGPNIILAVEAGLPVPSTLRMGGFSATSELAPEVAGKLQLETYESLEKRCLDPQTRLLAFSAEPLLNYSWSMPSFQNIPEASRARLLQILQSHFYVIQKDANFLLLGRRAAAPDIPGRQEEAGR